MHPFSLSHGLLSSPPRGNRCFTKWSFIYFLSVWQLLFCFSHGKWNVGQMVTLMYLMATAIFLPLSCELIPRLGLKLHSWQIRHFYHSFKVANMATAAGWQLLVMTHGNWRSPYMAIASFSTCFSIFLRFLPRHT